MVVLENKMNIDNELNKISALIEDCKSIKEGIQKLEIRHCADISEIKIQEAIFWLQEYANKVLNINKN